MQKLRTCWTGALTILALSLAASCQSGVGDTPTPTSVAAPISPAVVVVTGAPLSAPPAQPPDGSATQPASAFPYELAAQYGPAAYGKLSGIVYYPPRQSLMAVSDDGHISEITTNGTLIQRRQTRAKADFEGITYHPGSGRLYVAIEGQEMILEVNPDTLLAEREIPINRMVEGRILLAPEGDGIEGITFVPDATDASAGSFYLVNQSKTIDGPDPSVVFEVTLEEAANAPLHARITRYFSVGLTDLSGIDYAPASRRLIIVSDANDLLIEMNLTGELLASYPLPGQDQEGVAIDDKGSLYIAQDRKDTLYVYTAKK